MGATLGTHSLLADVLRIMMATASRGPLPAWQTYLDVILAHLFAVLRRDRGNLTPAWLSNVAGSLGTLHTAGLTARRASSGPSVEANRRCMETLSEQIVAVLEDFLEQDLARMGGGYLVAYMDDSQRRAALGRAAK